MLMMAMLAVQANDTPHAYVTFETTDGAKVSVELSSQKLTFSGTTLTIGTESYPISNLKKIYFSASDESNSTGIESVTKAALNESAGIYDLQGRKVTESQMTRGIYIVKTKDKTYKMIFK